MRKFEYFDVLDHAAAGVSVLDYFTTAAAVIGGWWLFGRWIAAKQRGDFAVSGQLPTLDSPMTKNLPRGIRNHNPGNLRPGSPWKGAVGKDQGPGGGYLIFDTPHNGIRALAKLLKNYQTLHKINTVRGVITRWAPASDNNNTSAYIAAVAAKLGVSADARIDLHSTNVLAILVPAIIAHENGQQPYSAQQIAAAIADA